MTSVAFDLYQNSVVIAGKVNGQNVDFILDTGDAVGPVFNSADAARLGLKEEAAMQVSGAGGASTSYTTTADITFDDRTWNGEPSAIDADLQGPSLLGLPFFAAKCVVLLFDFQGKQLTLAGL
jgi:predicted aspartyl protease